ncbi:hypothetical protein MtrunA17_Chr8g0359311 [Medicago truncatula]|uniref:Uncharacterized protein n=1 Tax=Medicago truncatula TaxID=3880 RepID=A0A072TP60_MEDTR|nr:uncharacterized protein LOC25501115 [Medicago truncatula]XP_024628036.1 uncharacterized protein LOC25501115 [Medicago truncatula]XP_024628037.1 uncharacterized protein LOC25501115 [Medicago truncatula]XP_024628038.1 uncharacterized protein LOC25501115 [Medicago truncatula]KEH19197.1 hypothetical protein MTR_8g042540 [Medicago truncatula]RHN40837.1 hypothetical protein MtrunA17_Chr8g0359311 [Medicago truncatula]
MYIGSLAQLSPLHITWELAYNGFCELILDRRTTALKLVDDCGNKWDCTLIFDSRPYPHFPVGGGFHRMILARRLRDGCHVMVGAPGVGSNDTLYFRIVRY